MPFWTQNSDRTRPAKYAGSWYEGNPARLRQELDAYLSRAQTVPELESNARLNAKSQPITPDVLAIIVPHAGYMFSGQTAAYAYKAAQENDDVRRVFLLGPAHRVAFRGAVLPAASTFATPLGDLQVDNNLIAQLKTYPMFSVQPGIHSDEHSLELQLPFIKHAFKNAKIVPIIVGQLQNTGDARYIGEILKSFIQKGDLVVVSSDFTHYGPRYDYVPFHGAADVPELVCKMDGEAFSYISKIDLEGFSAFVEKTEDTICGMYPCEVLLSMLPQGSYGSLLKYATSRESYMEDSENSVSYLAIVISGTKWKAIPDTVASTTDIIHLNADERKELLNLAKKTIDIFVKQKRMATPEELNTKISASMKECFGVFVTLSKKAPDPSLKGHKDLRGCIGSIYPTHPLFRAVQENAIASCSRDYRFMPVAESELGDLEIDINILTPPRRVASYNDIVIGRDGVILTKGNKQAVFLPQVAVEWNWDLEEMLTQLALKAGLPPDDWRHGAKFDIFQSEEIKESDFQ